MQLIATAVIVYLLVGVIFAGVWEYFHLKSNNPSAKWFKGVTLYLWPLIALGTLLTHLLALSVAPAEKITSWLTTLEKKLTTPTAPAPTPAPKA